MKRNIAIYAGTIAFLLAAGSPAFSQGSMEGGTPDSTMGKGAGTSTPKESTKADNRTDLTGGQEGVPENYADTPVRQGKLVEARDHKYKNATVHSSQGEAIGKIKELLKDTKTGEIEYAVFVPDESKRPIPLRWSQFQTKNDKLQLTLKKEEYQNAVRMNSSKDQSPDLQEYMDRINQVRSAPTAPGNPGVPGQHSGGATGSMGEESVGGGGPSGTSGLPSGQAPGFEGGQPSSKR
ncbi:PRC-barrel domain containing protein [Nitrospirales bacterium NOB]|nr:MAG: hypothetical protein UZ03_NOB001000253 [Nitrospira sp. OLB3]MBV6471666.1 hypothetical protein [Nitrospirota bacterium]MCE7965322.1 PRC-barrel domain containing protein [Nitrospira sp. NTP2]MDL1888366.1 PRC-barrel domain containing protein [Nitrospirales bacterium NOB]MEB2340247.1 PRC-barrel domain-containing protein [Nitrospirales bacterium]QOJ34392.1 MAG: PRC-barrel domain-containing protein [Nitrospira sp.]